MVFDVIKLNERNRVMDDQDEVLDIYGNLNPISPFAAIDTIAIAKKHEIKRYTKLNRNKYILNMISRILKNVKI